MFYYIIFFLGTGLHRVASDVVSADTVSIVQISGASLAQPGKVHPSASIDEMVRPIRGENVGENLIQMQNSSESLAHVRQNIALMSYAIHDEVFGTADFATGEHQPMAKQIAIPVIAFVIGAALLQSRSESLETFGKFAMFFGMQSAMNLYMKATLSDAVVGTDMHGLPAPFAVTASQQLVGFLLLVLGMQLSKLTPWRYSPQPLKDKSEYFSVVVLSLSFVLNIALNNFSLVFLDISVNMAIRSLQPVTTYFTQLVISSIIGEELKLINLVQAICLTTGIFGTVCVVYAKSGGHVFSLESSSMIGVILALLSLGAASLNMVLIAVLGTRCKLNPIDTLYYMSCPAFAFLFLPTLFYSHQVNWGVVKGGSVTDWWILMKVWETRPEILGLALLSGAFALSYNAFLYFIVQTLSATQATFAGSFNKVATIIIAICVGLEALPVDPFLRRVLILGVIGNSVSFTCYTLAGIKPVQKDGKN